MTSSNQGIGPALFTGQLQPGAKAALVMVDLVRAYFEPGADFFLNSDTALPSAARVLSAARTAGILVVHTRVSYTEGGADGGYFLKKVPQLKVYIEPSPLGVIMPEVAPIASEPIISKQYASAFFGTSLASTLTTRGIDTLIITGVSTSGCVRATAVDALQHGFIPIVVRDAVADREDAMHDSNLRDIQSKYGEVLSESEVIQYLAEFSEGIRTEVCAP